jgi:ribose-phosphate pyrophosphokinase
MGFRIYRGSANPDLAESVAARLGTTIGDLTLRRFSDGEIHAQIHDCVRGDDIYIIQSTGFPVNEHLMELLILVDAFRRSGAGRINAIIPYYGYSRQEKKSGGREPITAKLVANLLTAAGVDRVVSLDLHTPAIQGFFEVSMDHLSAVPILAEHLADLPRQNSVVVAPDVGRAKLADRFAQRLGVPLVVMHKRRPHPEVAHVSAVVGDVRDTSPIVVDDIIATGGTIKECAEALLAAGARPDIWVAAVHPLLAGPAVDRLSHPAITQVIVTDSVSLPPEKRLPRLTVLTIADLLAETIRCLAENRSLSNMSPPLNQAVRV